MLSGVCSIFDFGLLATCPLITCFCSVSGFFMIFSRDEISVLFVDLTFLGLVAQGLRLLLVGVAMLHHFSY